MSAEIFVTTKSHPSLTWLTAKKESRQVPEDVVQQLSEVKTMEQAQAFVQSAGLSVMTGTRRFTESVNSVTVSPPQSLHSIGCEQIDVNYHGPQVVLPKIECEEVPPGTVLMNCLLPNIEDNAKAEEIFNEYQAFVLAFSIRVKALPFACITGYKLPPPHPHNLYNRSFRFLFSSQPDIFYKRIHTMLSNMHTLYLLDRDGKPTKESRDLSWEIVEARYFVSEGAKIRHLLLNDIRLADTRTTTHLVDMR